MRTVGLQIGGALTLLAVSALAGSARAASLEPGVHVDPGSPAAKEYALPLNQARGTGAGSPSQTSPEGTLFGAGIKPPPSSGSGGGGRSRATARPRGGKASPQGASGAPLAALQPARRSSESSGGDDSTLALVGGGVAILVLGGFGGTVLRRSRHPRSAA